MKHVFRAIAFVLLAGPALALSAALAVPGPERLPADTWLLVNWHGVEAATRVRATNPVMRMWTDPQFAVARQQLIDAVTGRTGDANPLSRADREDVISILENPLVAGVTGNLMAGGQDAIHLFVVLNRKGKEAAWSRLREDAVSRPGREVTTQDFGGIQIRKTTTTRPAAPNAPGAGAAAAIRTSHAFEATLGDYELYTDQQELMELLLTRLRQATPGGSSLRDSAIFQKAQRHRAEAALLDVYLRIPDLTGLAIPALPPVDLPTVIRELHPERVEGLWLSAGMARDRLLVNGVLLGDMTPGSILDLLGANAAELRTPAVAPPTGMFNAVRLDLPALHATVLRAVRAGLPADQSAAASMLLDAMVAAQTGMRTADLLALFTGEIGTHEAHPGMDVPGLIMIPVTNGQAALDLVRTFAGQLIRAEQTVGGATVLSIASPAAAQGAAAIHVAVAPAMVLVAEDRAQLQGALARSTSAQAAPAGSLAADAPFRAARRSFPAQINGFAFADLSRLDWDMLLAEVRGQAAADSEETRSGAQLRQAFEAMIPLVKKHLGISAGASWKAADGWEFQSWIQ